MLVVGFGLLVCFFVWDFLFVHDGLGFWVWASWLWRRWNIITYQESFVLILMKNKILILGLGWPRNTNNIKNYAILPRLYCTSPSEWTHRRKRQDGSINKLWRKMCEKKKKGHERRKRESEVENQNRVQVQIQIHTAENFLSLCTNFSMYQDFVDQ